MNKIKFVILLSLLSGCRSVANWTDHQVLTDSSVSYAMEYVEEQKAHIDLLSRRKSVRVEDNLTDEELEEYLKIERNIAISSQKVANSWFNFFIELRSDVNYNEAYKGHYYFRKGIETLGYSDRKRREIRKTTLSDSKYLQRIEEIESLCRLAIAEIVAYNNTEIDTEKLLKEIKVIYKSMD